MLNALFALAAAAAAASSSQADPMMVSLLEPLSCARYAQAVGKYEPDYDVKDLDCMIGWLKQAKTYAAKGGKPTKYTNKGAAKAARARSLQALENLRRWLAAYDSGLPDSALDAESEADAKPRPPAPAAPTQSGSLDFKKP